MGKTDSKSAKLKMCYCIVGCSSEWRGGVSPRRSLSRWGYVFLFRCGYVVCRDEVGYAL